MIIGETDWRGKRQRFGTKDADRRLHTFILGKTGVGKTTLIRNMIMQDLLAGRGLMLIDPHEDLAESILQHIPPERTNDICYFQPTDYEHPIGLNILEHVPRHYRHLIADHVVSVFKTLYKDSWGYRLEYLLHNCALSLLDVPGTTLLGIPRLLTDDKYLARILPHIEDPIVRQFWRQEWHVMRRDWQHESAFPILNKVGQFLSTFPLRNILGQVTSSIDFPYFLAKQKVLIANLAKGNLGEQKSKLLGSLLVTKTFLTALSIPQNTRRDFHLYIDETANIATSILASLLSESRKYRLSVCLATQYLDQLDQDIQKSILGNCGTLIAFRCGSPDAATLEPEFSPEFTAADLQYTAPYQIVIRLAVDGLTSRPFSALTLNPRYPYRQGRQEKIIAHSRKHFGTPRAMVEGKIERWLKEKPTQSVPSKRPRNVPERKRVKIPSTPHKR